MKLGMSYNVFDGVELLEFGSVGNLEIFSILDGWRSLIGMIYLFGLATNL